MQDFALVMSPLDLKGKGVVGELQGCNSLRLYQEAHYPSKREGDTFYRMIWRNSQPPPLRQQQITLLTLHHVCVEAVSVGWVTRT